MTCIGLRSHSSLARDGRLPAAAVDRAAALDRFRRGRARTRALFDLLDESVYYDRPIPLRNPIVFYEGHLPAFAVNTLLKRALGRPGIDARLEEIFARGIDPDSEAMAVARGNPAWPSRSEVRAFAAAADGEIARAIESADLEGSHPMLQRAQALWAILEHEEMHQETLAYMWHEVPYEKKRAADVRLLSGNVPPPRSPVSRHGGPAEPDPPVVRLTPETTVRSVRLQADRSRTEQALIPAGAATLGTAPHESPFAWDNEMPPHRVDVPAFAIDRHNVTNAQFMAFVEAGGYEDARWWRAEDRAWIVSAGRNHPYFWQSDDSVWYWRGMFERVPLPPSWPVYVTWAEATAYARWCGMRLPSEAEFHRAAFGTPEGGERQFPWGGAVPGTPPANCDFQRWEPEPVGFRPDGVSAFGVHDLVGNGWEWTSTVFGPFPGFAPLASYPEYSADFFDAAHYVMKGASPATPLTLVRRGFRNWFRPNYPYVYATFRCAGPV